MSQDKPEMESLTEGRLEERPLPWLLTQMLTRKATGVMHIESGQVRTWIYFEQGFPADVHIPNSEVYLSMILREMGVIDDAIFQESLQIMARTNKLHGQVLLEMGRINQEQLVQAQLLQLLRKLVELFAVHSGVYRFFEGESIPKHHQPNRIHPYRVIYHGIKSTYQQEDLSLVMASQFSGKACRLSAGFRTHVDLFDLPADERADINFLVEPRRAEDFVACAKSGPTVALILLLTLSYCNMIEILEGSQAVTAPTEGPVFPPAGVAQTSPEGSPAALNPPASPPTPLSRSGLREAEVVVMLKNKVEAMKKGTFFEVLEVARDASQDQISTAFSALSKRYHPDRLPGHIAAEVRDVANFVYGRIAEAFSTLNHPVSRDEYAKKINSAGDGSTGKGNPAAALVAYEKAKVLISRKNFPEALIQLKIAMEENPQVSEYRVRYLWCDYHCAQPPKETKREQVIRELRRLAERAPGSFYVHRHLASLLAEKKEDQDYEHHLTQANSIRPTDIETARELRLLQMRKTKSKLFSWGK